MRALAHPLAHRADRAAHLPRAADRDPVRGPGRRVALVVLVPPADAGQVRLRRGGRGRHRPAAALAGRDDREPLGDRPGRRRPAPGPRARRSAAWFAIATTRPLDELPRPAGRVRAGVDQGGHPLELRRLAHARRAAARSASKLLAMWLPYLDRLGRPRAERPEGARLVHMFAHGFPRADASTDRPSPTTTSDGTSATPTTGGRTMRELLRHRDFRLLMIGQTLSMFGDTAMLLTLGMWAKDLSGSNAVAGSVFVALGLPTLLAPLGGLLIDRFRRRQVMIVVDLVTAVALLGAAVRPRPRRPVDHLRRRGDLRRLARHVPVGAVGAVAHDAARARSSARPTARCPPFARRCA